MLRGGRGLAAPALPGSASRSPARRGPPEPPEIPLFGTPFLRTSFFGDPHFGTLP